MVLPGFPNYLLFYRASRGAIEIVRFLNGARDLPKLIEDDV